MLLKKIRVLLFKCMCIILCSRLCLYSTFHLVQVNNKVFINHLLVSHWLTHGVVFSWSFDKPCPLVFDMLNKQTCPNETYEFEGFSTHCNLTFVGDPCLDCDPTLLGLLRHLVGLPWHPSPFLLLSFYLLPVSHVVTSPGRLCLVLSWHTVWLPSCPSHACAAPEMFHNANLIIIYSLVTMRNKAGSSWSDVLKKQVMGSFETLSSV